MKFTLVALLVAASANAGTLLGRQDFPSCATDCVANPKDLFGCGATDNKCLCTNQQFVAQTTTCITDACSASDAATAEAFSRSICEQNGITLTATPSASQTASGGASATSGAGSSAGSSSASAPAVSNTAPTTTGSGTTPSQTTNGAIGNSASVCLGAVALVFAAANL